MRSIVYFSTAVAPMSEEALTALADECAENDGHIGITGMLLHKGGDFLQVIEGSQSVINDMYARIVADPRHTNVRKICDRLIEHREFHGKESMGFTDLDKLPPETPYLNPFSFEAFSADPNLALLTLEFFSRAKSGRHKTHVR